MVYVKNKLENSLLSKIADNCSKSRKQLLTEIFQLDTNCKDDHSPYFINNLKGFVNDLSKSLDSSDKFKLEEIMENLSFMYNVKELKQNYKFGNIPEESEEENIKAFYKTISENCEIMSKKQISKAAILVHYLGTSSDWERVNYVRYLRSVNTD
jgi:hypothetical protein